MWKDIHGVKTDVSWGLSYEPTRIIAFNALMHMCIYSGFEHVKGFYINISNGCVHYVILPFPLPNQKNMKCNVGKYRQSSPP